MTFDIGAIRRAHKGLLRDTRRAIAPVLGHAGKFAEQHVARHAPRRTGRLARHTKHRVHMLRRSGKLVIFNRAKHAEPIEFGARPHVIVARNKKALRFRVGGRFVYCRRVNHPGNRAYKFLWRATRAAHRDMGRRLERELVRVAARF